MLTVVDTASGPAVLVTGLALRLISIRQGCEKAVAGAAEAFPDERQAAMAEAMSLGADHVAVLIATEIRAALVESLTQTAQTAPAEPKVGQYL